MKRLHSLAMLLVTVVVISVLNVVYIAVGATPSPSAAVLSSLILSWAFIIWIEADARRRHALPCHDFGLFVAITFPVSLFWYTLWSRGWRGLLMLAGLLGLALLPWLSAVVTWLLLYGIV